MPSAPPRACRCGAVVPAGKQCSRCARERHRTPQNQARRAAYDAARPSAAERGYDADWKRCRRLFLDKHPTCCEPGCTKPATDADHIESVKDRPDLRLHWSNLRPFCHEHHSARTARDQGFARSKTAAPVPASRPPVLRTGHFRMAVTIVCGPPRAGKTTFVRDSMTPGDLVIDLDLIAAALSFSGINLDHKINLPFACEARDALYQRIAQGSKLAGHRAWIVMSGAALDDRKRVAELVSARRVVVLETPAEECIRRLGLSGDPRPRATMVEAIAKWWAGYERHPADEIIASSHAL